MIDSLLVRTLASSPSPRGSLQHAKNLLGLHAVEVDDRTSLQRRIDWAISQHPKASPWLQWVTRMMVSGPTIDVEFEERRIPDRAPRT